jgi:hypothetical protein
MTILQDVDIELLIDGSWTSIVRLDNDEAGVYGEGRADVKITRGRQDETRDTDPSSCTFQVNNRDGRFSPRNPTSPYYGKIGRNTPVRVSVPAYESYMFTNGDASGNVSAPDSAPLSITGDIDLRLNADLDSWYVDTELISKWAVAAGQRSYLFVAIDGQLKIFWSNNGTTILSATSTSYLPYVTGRYSVRATLDVNNGASGNTVTFYYSFDSDLSAATWIQLGDAVVTAGTTSIFNGTSSVYLGPTPDSGTQTIGRYTKLYSVEIRNGIAGTVAGNPNFTAKTAGTTSFADTAGTPQTWTINSPGSIVDRDYRFYGEVSRWPQSWDPSGSDVWVDIEAGGLLRRLGQGAQAIGSAMRRSLSKTSGVVAYWPLEDGDNADVPTTGYPNGRDMTDGALVVSDFAAYTGEFQCTDPIAIIAKNSWGGGVQSYSFGSGVQLQWLMHVPGAGDPPDGTTLMRLFTSGTAARWDITYENSTGGDISIQCYDADGSSLLNVTIDMNVDGKDLLFLFQLEQQGSDVFYQIVTYQTAATAGSAANGTVSSRTLGRATGVHVNPPGSAGADQVAYGHIAVFNALSSTTVIDTNVVNAYRGETAGDRLYRLCTEEGLVYRANGTSGAQLGYQGNKTLLALLQEAALADGGFLYEDRELLGIRYRNRLSLCAEQPTVTLDYSAHQGYSLTPVEDDGPLRNDVTVKRTTGGSYRAVKETGALSVEAPPDGVGRYDETFELSLNGDDQIGNQAQWRLNLGTVDEPRWTLEVGLEQNAMTSAATRAAVRRIEIGHRLDISNPPAWCEQDTLRLIVIGYEETLSNFGHKFVFYTMPFAVFDSGVYDEDGTLLSDHTSRYAAPSGGTVTNEALDTTETAIEILNGDARFYWGYGDGDFDIVIGGEQITVKGVTGTGANQTFNSCQRSQNGVVKSHDIGATVELYRPVRRAL